MVEDELYRRVRQLVRMNYPKVRGWPPFTGRATKHHRGLAGFLDCLAECPDEFHRDQLTVALLLGLNWANVPAFEDPLLPPWLARRLKTFFDPLV